MRRGGGGTALALLVAAGACGGGAPAPPPGPPHYVDVSAASGIATVTSCGSPAKDHLVESLGSGIAFTDLDGDGRDDLLVLSGWTLTDATGETPRKICSRGGFGFFRAEGGGAFADRTEAAGLSGGGAWATGVAAGDIDGDGDVDLFVSCFGPDLLYRNRGDGTFEEIGAASGVADPEWGGCAAFFDAEGDGDLDLYVSNYIHATEAEVLAAQRTLVYKGKVDVMAGPFGMPGALDRFYRNRGNGTFEEAGEEAGLVDRAHAYGLGVIAADLDADGDVDLYVANDSNPNYLYRNDGAGHFEEIGVVSGAAFDEGGAAQAGMGVAVFDDDADGALDLFVTNFADDASTIYRGEGRLFYSDVSRRVGVREPTYLALSWGVVPLDYDDDGLTDLVIANGQIYPQVDAIAGPGILGYRQTNTLLRGRGGTFEDASKAAGEGFAVNASFRGVAVGDLDGDGGPDLAFSRIDEPPLLLRREGGDGKARLIVAPSHPLPRWFGARIDVTAGGRTQTRVVLSGGSFGSQSTLRPSFSLAGAAKADRVLVRFPGGETRELKDVPPGLVTIDVPR